MDSPPSFRVLEAPAVQDEIPAGEAGTRVLLLVEDHPGEALLVREMLSAPGADRFEIVHARSLAEARTTLRLATVDVVVLDLRLPDCVGIDTVREVREAAGRIPIVVLTGSDDEQLAMSCIQAGAQDYLTKSELKPQPLRRAIGYAVTRMREEQLRDLSRMLEGYRALSSSAQRTQVTASLVGSGALALRNPGSFEFLVSMYVAVVEGVAFGADTHGGDDRAQRERIATLLGDSSAGPRDLLDIHIAALERVIGRASLSNAVVLEARLLALEMMGLLVDYYRTGNRRRFAEGGSS